LVGVECDHSRTGVEFAEVQLRHHDANIRGGCILRRRERLIKRIIRPESRRSGRGGRGRGRRLIATMAAATNLVPAAACVGRIRGTSLRR
jgi:hypothetical protein